MSSARIDASALIGGTPFFALPALAWFLTPFDLPPLACHWLIGFAVYAGLKWCSWWDARTTRATTLRHVGYFFAWPGMDARAFLGNSSEKNTPTRREWVAATLKLAIGAVLTWIIAPRVTYGADWVFGYLAMVGLILCLYCGLFHLLSCAWRAVGVDAPALMNSPLLAVGVSDFWSRRWNIAFRDLMYRFLFFPLSKAIGPMAALACGFVVSGLLHELVITVPSRSGYGGPTAFFAIQAMAVLMERSAIGKRLGLGRGLVGRAFAVVTLLAPISLLFPPRFLTEIVIPFCRLVEAG